MSSLVSDFIINPVLRQARRFSEISRSTFGVEEDGTTARPSVEDAVPEDPGVETAVDMETSSTDLPTNVDRDTTFDEANDISSLETEQSPHDHLGFPVTPPKRTGPIPEDDGMGYLRARIHSINNQDICQDEKAQRIHAILTERYRAFKIIANPQVVAPADAELILPSASSPGRPESPSGLDSLKFWRAQEDTVITQLFNLTSSDIAPTFAPIRQPKFSPSKDSSPVTLPPATPPLGCQHYERNVKLQCSTCGKWYTCRFCHDAAEDHCLIRAETKNMLCMLCATPQRAGEVCIRCGETAATYYCDICKLWENRQSKPIYHCNDCGICRRGLGLGKDFFHCKTCRACITTSIETSHKCIERSTDCDCPICGEYMFTSPKPVVFMTCGHSIHKKCYDQHMRVSYKCPICNKSLVNMETQFRNLDLVIQGQPMPPEFQDTKAVILCNDCSGKCTVPYHWLGLKCSICSSYNTVELQILGGLHDGHTPVTVERADLMAPSVSESAEHILAVPPPIAVPRGSRGNSIRSIRRRHSSNVVELQQHVADRTITARSLSPLITGDSLLDSVDIDMDSDNDIFGFWRSGDGADDDDEEDEDDEDEESDHNPDDDDDDEEDANEIMLFGHR